MTSVNKKICELKIRFDSFVFIGFDTLLHETAHNVVIIASAY